MLAIRMTLLLSLLAGFIILALASPMPDLALPPRRVEECDDMESSGGCPHKDSGYDTDCESPESDGLHNEEDSDPDDLDNSDESGEPDELDEHKILCLTLYWMPRRGFYGPKERDYILTSDQDRYHNQDRHRFRNQDRCHHQDQYRHDWAVCWNHTPDMWPSPVHETEMEIPERLL
ncbi:hypothetical protein QBC47DRAFT_359238 [Echria macrotheca]|uniref:Secreted protein n=1 Tax=Echria macrotheca TaxID=438768 RepID=A0AAJ0BEE6_9PEZI|nr:hypothetical protein QBC47DRAFT_359238 [Echria macrotheca]